MLPVGSVTGLYLQITPKGAKSWILRATIGSKRGDFGLGGFPSVTLAQAREKAREARDKIDRGIDPIAERKAAKAALVATKCRGLTFADAMERYLAAKLDGFQNEKHWGQWRNGPTTPLNRAPSCAACWGWGCACICRKRRNILCPTVQF